MSFVKALRLRGALSGRAAWADAVRNVRITEERWVRRR
jgi:tagatose-1,6-bisphosphate aldolase